MYIYVTMSYKARCLKEKKEVTIKNPKFVVMSNCGVAVSGECPHCGTSVRQIVSASKAPADIQAKVAECKRKKAASKNVKRGGSRKSGKSKKSRNSRK